MDEKENNKKPEIVERKSHKDLLSQYIELMNDKPKTTYDEYINKKKAVAIGNELLPTDIKDNGVQKEIDELYVKACAALNNAIPQERKIAKGYIGDGENHFEVYNIKTGDAGNCSIEDEEYKDTLIDVRTQQWEHCIGELQEIDTKILHYLKKYEIIQSTRYTIEDIIDLKIKKMYQKLKNNGGEKDGTRELCKSKKRQ